MAKYLLLWELDKTKIPTDLKERAALWEPMIQRVKQNISSGATKDWGSFVGELKGFTIIEGDEMRINNTALMSLPYLTYTVHPFISVDEMLKVIDNLKK